MRHLLSFLLLSSVTFAQPGPQATAESDVTVIVNKSLILEHAGIRRIAVANPKIAEAVAVSAGEVLLNGKEVGDTSLIVWDQKDARTTFAVHVATDDPSFETVRRELRDEIGPDVSITVDNGNVFLRGTVKDQIAADRAVEIASTLGKVVNLLRAPVPEREPQILLKVRFANVDRDATSQLGFNLFSMDQKGISSLTTGQFGQPPKFDLSGSGSKVTLNQLLNVFYLRPDLNLGAMIQDLETKNVLQMLAEPNLLATSGQPASFLAGGEFPFPVLQGGANGIGQITIQFKEFGIRLNFVPTITPRGTIRLDVTPEVSSLDYANGLTINGFTMPGLSTRRIQTEVELENDQSFVIAGLLDNEVRENFNKLPGFSNIPVLGKLFESRNLTKTNTELLVLVTPELVRPIPAGVKPPEIKMPQEFLKGSSSTAPQTPVNGPVPALPHSALLPIEQLSKWTGGPVKPGGAATKSVPVEPVVKMTSASASQPPAGAKGSAQ
ncbi:MAG: pilus assembly protein N-terminal domain-containing protein [Acidobacteriaceae bacterium]|nr:pilus assembly protein N-terminal domain-containing protein [Acidobacteriaceae bacterium]